MDLRHQERPEDHRIEKMLTRGLSVYVCIKWIFPLALTYEGSVAQFLEPNNQTNCTYDFIRDEVLC